MKRYKVIYWNNGNVQTVTIEAQTTKDALYSFYMNYAHDDVIRIEEVE